MRPIIFILICLSAANCINIRQLIEEAKIDTLAQKLGELLSKAEKRGRAHKVMDKVMGFLASTPYIKQMGDNAQILLNIYNNFKAKTGLHGEVLWTELNTMFPNGSLFPPCSSAPYYSDNTLPLPKSSECCPIPEVTYVPDKKYRTIDGSCNCENKPNMGRSNRAYARVLAPDYADGIGAPRAAKSGNPLPSARKISTTIFNRRQDNLSGMLTVLHMTLGQMVDHDTDRTPVHKVLFENGTMANVDCGHDGCSTEGPENKDCFPIPIPEDDPYFKKECIMFVRSEAFMRDGCPIGPREQANVVTAWIDCSFVYGSTKEELDLVRDKSDPSRGKLLTTVNDLNPQCGAMVPHKEDGNCRDVDGVIQCFQTGDARQNEQNGVTASHIIFVREHNYFEEELHNVNPHWDGERLFQEARKLLIGVWQNIIYQEYLPPLLGPKNMKDFGLSISKGSSCKIEYDCENYNGDIANSFATASFRFGHAQIGDFMRLADAHFRKKNDIRYCAALFRPANLYRTHFDNKTCGVEAVFYGHSSQFADKSNRHMTEEMTQHMFTDEPPFGEGTDLAALDIERGRDHGLPGYTQWRQVCGLSVPVSFKTLTDIPKKDRNKLKQLYEHVDDIDLFVGAMAEKHIKGGIVGPTFGCLLSHQFKNIKIADRFWFERCNRDTGFSKEQISNIKQYTMGRFLCDTLVDAKTMAKFPMMVPLEEAMNATSMTKKQIIQKVGLYKGNGNKRKLCKKHPGIDFQLWKENP